MLSRPNKRAEVPRNLYKAAVDVNECRCRRERDMEEIRKSKRMERLLKKRREGLLAQQLTPTGSTAEELCVLPWMVSGVWSDDDKLQLDATIQFQKLLSLCTSSPIEKVIKSGVVPRLVEFLDWSDFPRLQFVAAWVLANIASGTSENIKAVVDQGAVHKFMYLLVSPNDDAREQAALALGNIAGDSIEYRDLVLSHGALNLLLPQLNRAKLSMLRNATWTLSNFWRGKPLPKFQQVRPALRALKRLIESSDEEVITNVCSVLSHLSNGTNDQIQAVVEAGICPQLVTLLSNNSLSVVILALRTIGNIASGNNIQTQCLIDNGALPCLLRLLEVEPDKNSIKKEVCCLLSNIAAGDDKQIGKIISAGLIVPLIKLLNMSSGPDLSKEVLWVIINATTGGNQEQIMYLASEGCLKSLCNAVFDSDSAVAVACLKAAERFLKVGEAEKKNSKGICMYERIIRDAQPLREFVDMQTHSNMQIYQMAVDIVNTYKLAKADTAKKIVGGGTGCGTITENKEVKTSMFQGKLQEKKAYDEQYCY